MPLTPGTRLGPYEIKSALGAGGMGEVYRAADSRLGRDVAIKVLPPHLSTSEEARTRFEREARTVSSLNHPHICTLFDVGREAGTDFLVMELVEGETLADRLARGALPIAEVLRIGRQVCDALDRAHRAGVIHRDLKPGNIMLAKNGAKLMDFGLARQTVAGQPGSGAVPAGSLLTGSPTMAQPLTTQGTILGTFQYMAPEQLEGKGDTDARSDIWALGCVLYEMATGHRAFEGATQASLISSIMRDMPRPMAERAPLSPPALERLINACLAKDPDERLQSAHDVGLQLAWMADGGSGISAAPVLPAPAARGIQRGERLAWIGALVGVLVLMGFSFFSRPRATAPDISRRFRIAEQKGQIFLSSTESAISPDGRTLAYVAADSTGSSSIWLQSLDSFEPKAVPGTRAAGYLHWSPDGKSLGFFADAKLKKLGLNDSDPVTLCEAPSPRGASWGSAGTIVFAPTADGPLMAVDENGGVPRVVTRLDTTAGEIGHRLPCFLPDGRHFLFLALPPKGFTYETWVGSLDGDREGPVMKATTVARYAPAGYLVFIRGRTLTAQPFDLKKLATTGAPGSLGSVDLHIDTIGEPIMSFSDNDILAITTFTAQETRLEWRDRTGRFLGRPPMPAGPWEYAVPSPDGRRAMIQPYVGGEGKNLSVVDLERGTVTRLTRQPAYDIYPTWNDSGRRVVYATNRDGPYKIVSLDASGSGEERVLHESPVYVKESPTLTADGRWLAFTQDNGKTGRDVMVVDLSGDRIARPLIQGVTDDRGAALSPNGRLIAYNSDESGTNQVYLASFPDGESRRLLSTRGGNGPSFTRGGREVIYYSADGGVWAVAVDPEDPGAEPGEPVLLFRAKVTDVGLTPTDDGERFLVTVSEERPVGFHNIILDWPAAIRE